MGDWAILVVALAFSAFFSGMEIAFLSANRLQLEIETKKGSWAGRRIGFFVINRTHFIGTMLTGNTVALVVVGIQTSRILSPLFENVWHVGPVTTLMIQTLVSSLVVLFVAEYLPKSFFRGHANASLFWFAFPLTVCYWALWPLVELLTKISRFVLKNMGRDIKRNTDPIVFGKADLDHYVQEGSASEQIEPEIELFRNALDFDEVKVRSCMVPRTEICAVNATITLEALRQKFTESGFSKLVVYNHTIDDAFAYVHAFGLFSRPMGLASILTPLSFVPETMSAQEVLKLLIREKRSMALVVDDLGSLTGIVALEDVIEELFGEIDDEHDMDIRVEERLTDGSWRLDASLEVDYLNETYAFDFPEEESYSTLGGLVSNQLGHLPVEGETLFSGDWIITIETMDAQRIGAVVVAKKEV